NRRGRLARFTLARAAARSGERKECLPVRPWKMWKQQEKIATTRTKAGSSALRRRESSTPFIVLRKKRGACSKEFDTPLPISLIGAELFNCRGGCVSRLFIIFGARRGEHRYISWALLIWNLAQCGICEMTSSGGSRRTKRDC